MDIFVERFGEKVGKSVRETLSLYSQAIEFLRDSQKVSRYIAGFVVDEDKVMSLRTQLSWFDCALLMLEGLDTALVDYDLATKKTAFTYLQRYYHLNSRQVRLASRNKSSFRLLWHWLALQNNLLLDAFLENWKEAFAFMVPLPKANTSYQHGSPYQNISFKVFQNMSEFSVVCQISFYWIEKKQYTQDKAWGKIEVEVPGDRAKDDYFTIEQQKQFFSMLCVDLFQQGASVKESKSWLARDLKCNIFGEFEIPANLDNIKNALHENSLACVIRLSCTEGSPSEK